MQGRLSGADTRLLWWAGGIVLVFLIAAFALAPSRRTSESPIPSSYSSDSRGALAAYTLLAEQHFPVERWNDAPSSLPTLPKGAMLILAEPSEAPEAVDRKALQAFLENGGRVLFCGASVDAYLPAARVDGVGAEWKQYGATVPSPFTRDADPIEMDAPAFWDSGKRGAIELYGPAKESPVATWKVGEGEVLWWASPTPLTNIGISKAQNLQLFLNAVNDSSGAPLHIYWDEYFHGQHGSLWTYIEKTPLPWGMLQLGGAVLFGLFTFSRRSGPIASPPAVSRLSPLEFVETMGALYQNAGGGRIAVEASDHRLRRELAQRLHLSPSAPIEELARIAGERLRQPENELREALADAHQSMAIPKLSAKSALVAVQKLEACTHRLKYPMNKLEETKS